MSSTLLRSSSEYGTAQTNLPVKGWEGAAGFLHQHSFPHRGLTALQCRDPGPQDCMAVCFAGLDLGDGSHAQT